MKKRLLVSALLALGLAGADPVVDPVDDGAGPGAPDRELASDDMIEGMMDAPDRELTPEEAMMYDEEAMLTEEGMYDQEGYELGELPEQGPGPGARIELTDADYEKRTKGKLVLIKFLSPWCGHCKKLKPAWDSLMDEFNTPEFLKTSMVADVDCEGEGSSWCGREVGMAGYPTIRWGTVYTPTEDDFTDPEFYPPRLHDYRGERDLGTLRAFVEEHIAPSCGPARMDLCTADQKAFVEKVMKMSDGRIAGRIRKKESSIAKLEADFEKVRVNIVAKNDKLKQEHEASIAALKARRIAENYAVMSQLQQSRWLHKVTGDEGL